LHCAITLAGHPDQMNDINPESARCLSTPAAGRVVTVFPAQGIV
jgi:hypothetical protein